MIIIGLTGQTGAGKSIIGEMLAALGIPNIDTDKVYHDLLVPPSPCLRDLVGAFGNGILDDKGCLDRSVLASIVFGDAEKEKINLLNKITHAYVIEKTKELINLYRAEGKRAVLLDVPLLYESGMDAMCDFCVAVLADQETRAKRIMERDGLTKEKARERIEAQPKDEFYLSRAAYCLYNDADIRALENQVRDVLQKENLL